MAYKCKTCGYVFKKSDSDLCPECFTARDDISCFDAGENHNHFKETDSGEDSFIQEQMRQEAAATPEEISEKIHGVTDSFKRNFSEDTPPNTYAKTPQQQTPPPSGGQTINSPYNQGRSTLYHTTGVGKYGAQYYTSMDQINRGSGGRQAAKAPKWLVGLILCMFFLPFIISIGTFIIGFVNNNSRSNRAVEVGDAELPEVSSADDGLIQENDQNIHTRQFASMDVYDEEIYMTVKDFEFADNYDTLEECKNAGIVEFNDVSGGSPDYAGKKNCALVYCTLSLDTAGFDITDCAFMSADDLNTIYYEPFEGVSGKEVVKFPMFISADINDYLIYVNCRGKDNEEEKHIFNCYLTYGEIMELSGQTSYFSEPVGNESGSGETGFYSYDYTTAPFETSLKDDTGRNVQLKFTGNSAEIVEGSEDKEHITLIDSDLATDSWALYQVKLVGADQNHADIDCRYKTVSMFAYDANNKCVYTYLQHLNGAEPELALCKKVQYFYCIIDYVDASGTPYQANFSISASDLYNS